jgi:hypothetical protein
MEVLQTSALPLGYAADHWGACCQAMRIIITMLGFECKGFLPGYYPELQM